MRRSIVVALLLCSTACVERDDRPPPAEPSTPPTPTPPTPDGPALGVDVDVECDSRRSCSVATRTLVASTPEPSSLSITVPDCETSLEGNATRGVVVHGVFARAGVTSCAYLITRGDELVRSGNINWHVPMQLIADPFLIATTATPGRFRFPATTGDEERDATLAFHLESANDGLTQSGNELVFTPTGSRSVYNFFWSVYDPVAPESQTGIEGHLQVDTLLWIGSATDDVFDPANWLPAQVPNANTSVVVNSDLHVAGGTLSVGNLAISDYVTVTIDTRLEVSGDIESGGSFVTDDTGELALVGSGTAHLSSTINHIVMPFAGIYDGTRRIGLAVSKDVVVERSVFLEVGDVTVDAGTLATPYMAARSLTVRDQGSLDLVVVNTRPIGEGEGEGESLPEGGSLIIAGAINVSGSGRFIAPGATVEGSIVSLAPAALDLRQAIVRSSSSIFVGDVAARLVGASLRSESLRVAASVISPELHSFDVHLNGELDLATPTPVHLALLAGNVASRQPLDVGRASVGELSAPSALVHGFLSATLWQVPETTLAPGARVFDTTIEGNLTASGARIGSDAVGNTYTVVVAGRCSGAVAIESSSRLRCAHADTLQAALGHGHLELPDGAASLDVSGEQFSELLLGGVTTMTPTSDLSSSTLRLIGGNVDVQGQALLPLQTLLIDAGCRATTSVLRVTDDVVLTAPSTWQSSAGTVVEGDLVFPTIGSSVVSSAGIALNGDCRGVPRFVGPTLCRFDNLPVADTLVVVSPVGVSGLLPGGDADGGAVFALDDDGVAITLLDPSTGAFSVDADAIGRRGYTVDGNITDTRAAGEVIVSVGALLWDGATDDAGDHRNWRFDNDTRRLPFDTEAVAVVNGVGAVPPTFSSTTIRKLFVETDADGVTVAAGQTLSVDRIDAGAFVAGRVAVRESVSGALDVVFADGLVTATAFFSANSVTLAPDAGLQLRRGAAIGEMLVDSALLAVVDGQLDVATVKTTGVLTLRGDVTGRELVVAEGASVVVEAGLVAFDRCVPATPDVVLLGSAQFRCGAAEN